MTKAKILLMAVYSDTMLDYFEEIGIGYIASFLRQHGYEVMLIGAYEKRIDYDKIVDYCPDIVGITIYEDSKLSVYRTIEKIKQLLPRVFICIGGPMAPYYGVEILTEFQTIDFVVRGEGESTFLELVSQFPGMGNEKLEKIKGLTYRSGKRIIENEDRPLIEDIDILPDPARDVIRDNRLRSAEISTSRGCKSKCTFCISSLFWKKWRGRSVERVLEEIENLVTKYGVTTFDFVDGSFEDPGPDVARIRDIAAGIVKRKLNIAYYANIRAEFHRKASPDLIELLKESGLCGVCVGIEAGNEFDLKLYGKLASLEDNARILELLRKHEIAFDTGFINFNPYSTFQGLQKNIDFLETNGVACNFWIVLNKYQIYKGNRLYYKVERDSLLKEGPSAYDRYRFVDERISHLHEYLKGYTTKIDKENNNAVYLIAYHSAKYLPLLTHLKRQAKIAGENDLYKIALESQQGNRDVITNMSHQAARWFRELLKLAENGWDTAKADEISNIYLNPDDLSKTAAALNKYKNRLYKEVVKRNLDSHLVRVMGAQ